MHDNLLSQSENVYENYEIVLQNLINIVPTLIITVFINGNINMQMQILVTFWAIWRSNTNDVSWITFKSDFIGSFYIKECFYYDRFNRHLIETRKYHHGASVPKQGTKYHCQRTKNRDFQQLTRVQWKNVNHIAGGVVQVHCRNSYNAKYARRATSNQLCVA